MGKAFTWLAREGGAWALGANWNDVTDGIDPSLLVPGAGDSATVTGPGGSQVQTITGPGAAAVLAMTGNTSLSGAFTVGTLIVGNAGASGLLELLGGSALEATMASLYAGSLVAGDAGTSFAVGGALTLGGGTAAARLSVSNGARVDAGSVSLASNGSSLSVDTSSVLEVGSAGGAVAGALTVDAGAVLSGHGWANAYAAVVNNGEIAAAGGTLLLGKVAGAGTLDIGAGATLELTGTAGAGEAVAFTGMNATLAITMELNAPAGSVSGFAPGDVLDVLGSPLTGASFAANGTAGGVLSLTYGGQLAASLALVGNYTGDVFLLSGDSTGGTDVTVAPAGTGGGGGASPGTSTPDQYVWVAPGSGGWNVAANWRDATTGASPAAIAPGSQDLVTVAGPVAGGFGVIGGPGNAASLAIAGAVALSGAYQVGTLTVGTTAAAATLDLLAGASLAAGGVSVANGAISVSGSLASLSVAGTLSLGAGVGLPATNLSAAQGGIVTAAALTLAGGAITTDPTGVIEIGHAGGAARGAVTVDAGATVTGDGSLNPFGTIHDNGAITAAGGLLTLGTVSGTGTLLVGAGGDLALNRPTALGIGFLDGTGTLTLPSEVALPTGVISGFTFGDVIDIAADPVTGISFATGSNGVGTLTLVYGTAVVGKLLLAGTYSADRFAVVPDGGTGTDILVIADGGGGGGGGSGNTDILAWASPVSGNWDHFNNWFDLTTGLPSAVNPGAGNAVQIVGPSGGAYENINGPGQSASLTLTGNTSLTGSFGTGTLTIGVGVLPGGLDMGGGSTLTVSGAATLALGQAVIAGTASLLSVAGTLAVAGGGLVAAQNHAAIELGALALAAGASVTVDAVSTVEIGTAGGAAAGVLTVDAGALVSGNGSLDAAGTVIDNGTITASGGTLAVGRASGSGTMLIGDLASLALSAGTTVPVGFAGAGGTLILPGSAELPARPISGFASGDMIDIAGSPISAVSYAAGAGGLGTLTLSYGGVVAGHLLLAGNYAGDSFSLVPDGQGGTSISVQTPLGGPSPGTPTPDVYVWTGTAGINWNDAGNWNDVTAGQTPAAIAPGAHDSVTITGPAGGAFQSVTGPADAASLALLGQVALSGTYTVGALEIGAAGQAGLLALGPGSVLAAASGGFADGGAALSGAGTVLQVSGALTLGLAGSAGLLSASGGAAITVGGLVLAGNGSAVATDGSSSIEVGAGGHAQAGIVVIDAGAGLSGAGTVNLTGSITDAGTVTASGGTLVLGNVSGAGTLLVGPRATLDLAGSAGASLILDFAGAGTLSVAGALPLAGIEGFVGGDTILLPVSGITSAQYAQTGAGTGVLMLTGGGRTLGMLTLLGNEAGQAFSVTGAAGGGTILTTGPVNTTGGGGGMSGQVYYPGGPAGAFEQSPLYLSETTDVQNWLDALFISTVTGASTVYLDTSTQGTPGSFDLPLSDPPYVNFATVTNPNPGGLITMPTGYKALLVQGNAPTLIADDGAGNELLVGNAGQDTIIGNGYGDTLVGGSGPGEISATTFFAGNVAVLQGGGNDYFVTGNASDTITTAAGYRSTVFLGASYTADSVTAMGTDTVVGAGYGVSNDVVQAVGSTLVFGPAGGQMNFYGGAAPDTVVAGAGTMVATGGTGSGSQIWGGSSYTAYYGGSGQADLVGGSGQTYVAGGSGAMTIFGGTGQGDFTLQAGPSLIVTGNGPTTVTAASGNQVWLTGAANNDLIATTGNIGIYGVGSYGNNIFEAGNGNVTLQGGHGHDTFSFTAGHTGGLTTILDFNLLNDRIALNGYGGSASSLLASDTVSGGNTELALSDGTHILLVGITGLGAGSFA